MKNSHEEEFFENYEIYKIELNNYDLKQYVEEELITSEIINQYFEENTEEFIEPKRYTYGPERQHVNDPQHPG